MRNSTKTKFAFNVAACTLLVTGAYGAVILADNLITHGPPHPDHTTTGALLYAATCYGKQHDGKIIAESLNDEAAPASSAPAPQF